ncbi:PqqD family peptide modification chaperone [Raineyella sp. LH-20]|uniref:PqqD family peptide modification chaperone n=1 Tax=Raineyella sp. LH-20 TaxID=3081204 RepID=UPI0029551631|nr:PqqD family peptide modification chaperone [Raineyella sp. LH-20]WOP17200.1 hypothetical protein R0146_07830 [Raineyella sp. LH-20]
MNAKRTPPAAGTQRDRPGYAVPDGVGVVEVDGVIYLAPLPRGPIRVLAGSAAVIWQELLDGAPDTVDERVAAICGVERSAVTDGVAGFVGELLRSGLLERR